MLLEIRHRTSYAYSEAVFIEPHLLRLQPRSDVTQRLEAFELRIEPEPSGMSAGVDCHGNDTQHAWFSGIHPSLTVTAVSRVRTLRENPWDYLIDARNATLPPRYSPAERAALAVYRRREKLSTAVEEFADSVRHSSRSLASYVQSLNREIWERIEKIHRPEGDPLSPEQLLAAGAGACRDLTVLYVVACRRAGIAARFVSGFLALDEPDHVPTLHAWPEVYISTAGWRGFDPTHAVATAAAHVAIAAGPTPAAAAPVVGTYRGDAKSTISTEVDVRILESG